MLEQHVSIATRRTARPLRSPRPARWLLPLSFASAYFLGSTVGVAAESKGTAGADKASPAPSASSPASHRPESKAPVGQLTKAPELTRFVEAPLPEGTEPLRVSVAVLLELTVEADGQVSNVRVASPKDAALDEAARKAVSEFQFSPAEVDGTPSSVRIQYEYVFEAEPTDAAGSEVVPGAAEQKPSVAITPAQPEPPAPSGQLEGRLLESGTRRPIIGATVALVGSGEEVLTDGQGRFKFHGVPVGKVQLRLTDSEHATVVDSETVAANSITDVTYYAPPTGFAQDDLVAVGQKTKKQVVRRALSIREIATAPGTNGDALKAVQNLPGVARTHGDQVILRGGGGSQVFVNGHPVGTAFHFGGLRSTIGNGLIGSLEVTPGNYDARYGNANGGIVDIETRRPATEGYHGVLQADLFDAGVFVEGPVSDNGSLALGVRRSYIDGVLALVLSDEDKETFTTAPRYHDYQGAYHWQKGRHRLRINAFGASDEAVFMLKEPTENDPAARGKAHWSTEWVTGQALWDMRISELTQLSTGVSYLRGDFDQLLGEAKIRATNHQVTLRADLTHEVNDWLTVRAGLNGEAQYDDYDVSVPRAPEEGSPQASLSLQEFLTSNGTATAYRPAAYGAAEIQLGPLLAIPALRVSHYSKETLEGKTLLEPRIDARLPLTTTTVAKLGVGMYSKAAELHQTDKTFGNPDIQAGRSVHYSFGVEQQLSDAVSLDATGFYKHLYHQVVPVKDPAVKYGNTGLGRVYGGEFLLKHDARSRFYGWVAYTLMRSERKAAEAEAFRIFDGDQTHNVNVVGQFRLTPTWEVGARFRYVTGNPMTKVVGSTFDSDADVYAPRYGAPNAGRVGAFHQLDVRVDKHWRFDTWQLTSYLDVQNVYNQKNPEGTSYNFDFSKSRATPGLPIIPSLGLKGEF